MKITENELMLDTVTPSRDISIVYNSQLNTEKHPFIRAWEYCKLGFSLDSTWEVPKLKCMVFTTKENKERTKSKRMDIDDEISVTKSNKKANTYTKLLGVKLEEIEL